MCGIYAVTTCVGLNKPWHELHIFTGRGRRTCPPLEMQETEHVSVCTAAATSLSVPCGRLQAALFRLQLWPPVLFDRMRLP